MFFSGGEAIFKIYMNPGLRLASSSFEKIKTDKVQGLYDVSRTVSGSPIVSISLLKLLESRIGKFEKQIKLQKLHTYFDLKFSEYNVLV